MNPNHEVLDDSETLSSLEHITVAEQIRTNRVPGVKTILFVLSAKGMVFDTESLKQKAHLSYPDSEVFFLTPGGKPVGTAPPSRVDLLVDFTGPRTRQGLFFARALRRKARMAVGRDSGLFRKKIYDRIYDEAAHSKDVPQEQLQKERTVQRRVMGLAGIAFVQAGDSALDRGKVTPLELPPLARH